MAEELKLLGKLIISYEINCESGLHIGGSNEGLGIGGVDNAVIKLKNGNPYIPGSSLKGKLRSLLEKKKFELNHTTKKDFESNNKEGFLDNGVHLHKEYDEIYRIFGSDAESAKEPVRMIVRDCIASSWTGSEQTEIKAETAIDRITSAANPRKMERVPAGTKFKSEIILNMFREDDKDLLDELLTAMKLLEDDYLGGSGSRGSGKVKFVNFEIEYRPITYYEGETEIGDRIPTKLATLNEFENEIEKIKGLINNESNQTKT